MLKIHGQTGHTFQHCNSQRLAETRLTVAQLLTLLVTFSCGQLFMACIQLSKYQCAVQQMLPLTAMLLKAIKQKGVEDIYGNPAMLLSQNSRTFQGTQAIF